MTVPPLVIFLWKDRIYQVGFKTDSVHTCTVLNINEHFKRRERIDSVQTYLRNCGRKEFHPGADCFRVR